MGVCPSEVRNCSAMAACFIVDDGDGDEKRRRRRLGDLMQNMITMIKLIELLSNRFYLN